MKNANDKYSWFDAREKELEAEAKSRYSNDHSSWIWHRYHSASDRYVDVYHKKYVE